MNKNTLIIKIIVNIIIDALMNKPSMKCSPGFQDGLWRE